MNFLDKFIEKYDLELTEDAVVVATGECVRNEEDGYYVMASNDETDNIIELGVVQEGDICLVQLTKEDAIKFANTLLNKFGGR